MDGLSRQWRAKQHSKSWLEEKSKEEEHDGRMINLRQWRKVTQHNSVGRKTKEEEDGRMGIERKMGGYR